MAIGDNASLVGTKYLTSSDTAYIATSDTDTSNFDTLVTAVTEIVYQDTFPDGDGSDIVVRLQRSNTNENGADDWWYWGGIVADPYGSAAGHMAFAIDAYTMPAAVPYFLIDQKPILTNYFKVSSFDMSSGTGPWYYPTRQAVYNAVTGSAMPQMVNLSTYGANGICVCNGNLYASSSVAANGYTISYTDFANAYIKSLGANCTTDLTTLRYFLLTLEFFAAGGTRRYPSGITTTFNGSTVTALRIRYGGATPNCDLDLSASNNTAYIKIS